METPLKQHCGINSKKVGLLRDLVECLEREKKSLFDLNVAELWAVMEEKHSIVHAIEDLSFEKTSGELTHDEEMVLLKEEIRSRVRENTEFARSSLALFDELISRIAGAEGERQTYGPPGTGQNAQRNPVFCRKV